jgi:cytochrome c oxidase subunit IV
MLRALNSADGIVWLVLMVITGFSWFVGANHGLGGSGPSLSIILLISLAYFKIRLVILYFMEVRHGPILLRIGCELWVVCSWIGTVGYLADWF